jgi:PAS domain S-box-containing protein
VAPSSSEGDRPKPGSRVELSVSRDLATTLDWAPGFICILKGPQHVVEFVNRSHRRLFRSADWLGKPAREAIPDVTAQGFHDLLDQVYRSGERFVGSDLPVTYRPEPGAPEVTLYHDFVYEPIRDDDGRVTGVFCEGLDVTSAHEAREELKRHLERQSFRLDVERSVTGERSATGVMRTTARLIAGRWGADRLAITEQTPGAGASHCRRTLHRTTGHLDESAVDGFGLDAADQAAVAGGSALVRSAGEGSEAPVREVVVPRIVDGALAAVLDVAWTGGDRPSESEVALLEDVSRRMWETVDRVRAEAERDRFFDASLDLLCIASLDDGRIRRASRSFADVLGWQPEALVGTRSIDLVHPDDRQSAAEIAPSLEHGGSLRGFEQRVRRKDGSYRWISWSTTPVPEENLLYGVGRDVTERREFDRQRDIFIAELNHRVKNTLAVVQAMASQTFRAERGDPSKAIAKYQKRIAAVASAHDLLTDNNWGPVLLGDLVRGIALRGGDGQVAAEGPDLPLSPRQAVAMSLALNELLENARTHGALGRAVGAVTIRWTLEEGGRFGMSWEETGGTAPAPDRDGFGTRLLGTLGEEFDGTTEIDMGSSGFVFRLTGRVGA